MLKVFFFFWGGGCPPTPPLPTLMQGRILNIEADCLLRFLCLSIKIFLCMVNVRVQFLLWSFEVLCGTCGGGRFRILRQSKQCFLRFLCLSINP